MRNISLVASSSTDLPNANIAATTWDLDDNVLYIASEVASPDGEVEVTISKLNEFEGSSVRNSRCS